MCCTLMVSIGDILAGFSSLQSRPMRKVLGKLAGLVIWMSAHHSCNADERPLVLAFHNKSQPIRIAFHYHPLKHNQKFCKTLSSDIKMGVHEKCFTTSMQYYSKIYFRCTSVIDLIYSFILTYCSPISL